MIAGFSPFNEAYVTEKKIAASQRKGDDGLILDTIF